MRYTNVILVQTHRL